MTRTERAMLHDALAEAVRDYRRDPTDERRLVLTGMRYLAVLLGMAEGQPNYDWDGEAGPPTVTRDRRRLTILRRGRAL